MKDKAQMLLPEARQFGFGHGADLVPPDKHLALGGLFQPGKLVQQCGFAAAGLPDNAAEFPFFYVEVDVVQRDHTFFADGVDLAQFFGMDDGCQTRAPFPGIVSLCDIRQV